MCAQYFQIQQLLLHLWPLLLLYLWLRSFQLVPSQMWNNNAQMALVDLVLMLWWWSRTSNRQLVSSNIHSHISLHTRRLWCNSNYFWALLSIHHVICKNLWVNMNTQRNRPFQVICTRDLTNLPIWIQTFLQLLVSPNLSEHCQAYFSKNRVHIFSWHLLQSTLDLMGMVHIQLPKISCLQYLPFLSHWWLNNKKPDSYKYLLSPTADITLIPTHTFQSMVGLMNCFHFCFRLNPFCKWSLRL